MASYLVTGVAGFLGAALSQKLLQQGHGVVGIDNLSTGYLESVPQGCDFYQGDCQDASLYDRLPAIAYDAIYHIAGQSSAEVSFEDPVYDLQTNTQSTLLLLQFAIKTGCQRFLFASSMSVYGDAGDRPMLETDFCVPKSFYAVGKLASEQYLSIYESKGVHCTSLRICNLYGPGQNMNNLKQGMVSIYLSHAINNKKILVKGSADRFRDFLYIDDIVETFLHCEKNANTYGRIINAGTGVKTTIATLLEKMQAQLPFSVAVEFAGNTPGDQFGVYGNTAAMAALINYQPEHNLDEGLKQMIAWAIPNALS